VQNAKKGFLGNLNQEIIKESDFVINNYPGVYVEAESSEYYSIAKLIIVDNRLYQIAILSTGGKISNKKAKKYLNSFEFVKK